MAKEKTEECRECPICHNTHLTIDPLRGYLICDKCGTVLEETSLDTGPDWRAYDAEQEARKARAGPPTTITRADKGLGTPLDKEVPGHWIGIRKGARERSLSTALWKVKKIVNTLGVPKFIEESADLIYRKAVEKKLTRGRSIDLVVTAAVYSACRQHNIPRTLEEMARVAEINKKEIARTYRVLSKELKLRLEPPSHQSYIARFCSELKLGFKVQKKAEEILKNKEILERRAEKVLTAGTPTGDAATAIYLASILCKQRRSQREVADAAGVTEVTIRNRYKNWVKKLGLKINIQNKRESIGE